MGSSSSSSCAVGVESSGFVEEKRTENAGRLIGEGQCELVGILFSFGEVEV